MSKITIDQAVVEQALDLIEENFLQLPKSSAWQSIQALRAALDQPQRNPTAQDIADSALLGNIESPFNACMHQEHCKRWKVNAGADSSLRAAVQQACDWISEEPGRRPISAGRLLAILTNALAAAPQPPTVKESLTVEQPQGELEPVASLADAIRAEPTELIRKWRVLELIQDHTRPQPKPLTDEAVLGVAKSIEIQFDSERLNEQIDDILAFARAIERAHGIGGDL